MSEVAPTWHPAEKIRKLQRASLWTFRWHMLFGMKANNWGVFVLTGTRPSTSTLRHLAQASRSLKVAQAGIHMHQRQDASSFELFTNSYDGSKKALLIFDPGTQFIFNSSCMFCHYFLAL